MVSIATFIFKQNMLRELPFFPVESDPLTELSVAELLLNGHLDYKFPADGFLGFHSLKMCSSNAKQMARYLELSMGFTEIAYKGLETNSRKLASHIVKNGSVVFEIINTLETVDEKLQDSHVGKNDTKRMQHDYTASENYVMKEFKKNMSNLVKEVVEDELDACKDPLFIKNATRRLVDSTLGMLQYIEGILKTENFVKSITHLSKDAVRDTFESLQVQEFVKNHGEGVMDISFSVVDVEKVFKRAISNGASIVELPHIIADENGSVKVATISVPYTDIHHTLIEDIDYTGPFLPTYQAAVNPRDVQYCEQLDELPKVEFECVDHCVENYTWNQMMTHAKFYARVFGFHRYWSVDEKDVYTGETALRSIVLASSNGKIKMPINEPARGKKRGQIEEFYDFNGGPGVQHIAIKTRNIVATVEALKRRGIDFNPASEKYYATLEQRLIRDDVKLREDFQDIKRLNILVDYDPLSRNKKTKVCNYILQIFTKPLHDRPTLFIEIIQRYHHNGFGKGTFKGLFETIEEQQRLRGTLVPVEYYEK